MLFGEADVYLTFRKLQRVHVEGDAAAFLSEDWRYRLKSVLSQPRLFLNLSDQRDKGVLTLLALSTGHDPGELGYSSGWIG